MSETGRQNQFHADTVRKNEERRSRSQELLNTGLRETSEVWNAAQVAAHEKLFPFSDNLTTLMFIVASDPSETQKQLTNFLSIQGMDVTNYNQKK